MRAALTFGKKSLVLFYPTQKAYIYAKQLDLFASLHKKGAQSFMFNRDTTFKMAKEWTLSVAESDILNYSLRSFWVL